MKVADILRSYEKKGPLPMRFRHKSWKNGKAGEWNCRIIWFQEDHATNIRLNCQDCDGTQNLYPVSLERANRIWKRFKTLARNQRHEPFVEPTLKELQ